MRRISIKSPIILSGLILCACVVILTPSWKSIPTNTKLPGFDALTAVAASREFLEPTVGQPKEIVSRPDIASVGVQPIGVTKKNSWNPNPSWRTEAGWPTSFRPADLRPVTIEKIPEKILDGYPLTARDKSTPPTTGDAIQKKPEFVTGSRTIESQDALSSKPSSKIIPWNAFVEQSSSVARKAFAGRDALDRNIENSALVAPGNSPTALVPSPSWNASASFGRTVSTGQGSQGDASEQTIGPRSGEIQIVTDADVKAISPVDAQRFIRQPKTRR